ncbi:Pro-neuregulin-3, membrane-bound isoform [Liparis tanakae]|uniref:Pro-neuregulin-3, membrane-bound isoform n=1 Tax=Liparis tanakae TaxID=230148 RepID=A0A4Z2GWI2_9TELE|nr:Pro-neuregulin-3, membrane-bound isoform [Liparis tanakae]
MTTIHRLKPAAIASCSSGIRKRAQKKSVNRLFEELDIMVTIVSPAVHRWYQIMVIIVSPALHRWYQKVMQSPLEWYAARQKDGQTGNREARTHERPIPIPRPVSLNVFRLLERSWMNERSPFPVFPSEFAHTSYMFLLADNGAVFSRGDGKNRNGKCREGYQGIRCDQFLPKTDSILTDPNNVEQLMD